jgi:hypothetical protein
MAKRINKVPQNHPRSLICLITPNIIRGRNNIKRRNPHTIKFPFTLSENNPLSFLSIPKDSNSFSFQQLFFRKTFPLRGEGNRLQMGLNWVSIGFRNGFQPGLKRVAIGLRIGSQEGL